MCFSIMFHDKILLYITTGYISYQWMVNWIYFSINWCSTGYIFPSIDRCSTWYIVPSIDALLDIYFSINLCSTGYIFHQLMLYSKIFQSTDALLDIFFHQLLQYWTYFFIKWSSTAGLFYYKLYPHSKSSLYNEYDSFSPVPNLCSWIK